MTLAQDHPLVDGRTTDAPLVRAARGERGDRLPVWFMRQAGRSLPEYKHVRGTTDMLDACLTPELAAEITLQPVRRHGVDAAVFYSDIVVPVLLAGVQVSIVPGRGPVFDTPIRTSAQIDALPTLDDEALSPIREAVAITVAELGSTPLIGFAGAPFTLASYLVEGGPSKDQLRARALMHADPAAWSRLLDWCADISGAFMRAQVTAGASVVQQFDSWAGTLSRDDYIQRVAPHSARTFTHLDGLDIGRIHFGLGLGHVADQAAGIGATVVGVDWREHLDDVSARLGHAMPLQGNIDTALLFAGWDALEANVRDVVRRGKAAPAHIVNLGHGVPPETDPTVLTRIVDLVHSL